MFFLPKDIGVPMHTISECDILRKKVKMKLLGWVLVKCDCLPYGGENPDTEIDMHIERMLYESEGKNQDDACTRHGKPMIASETPESRKKA
jgi:hypothetical protein